jgi:hypothetical protein
MVRIIDRKRYAAQVSDTTMMTIAASLFGQKITHNLCLDKS